METGAQFLWSDPCVELGAAVGYDEAASRAAYRDLAQFLDDAFFKD